MGVARRGAGGPGRADRSIQHGREVVVRGDRGKLASRLGGVHPVTVLVWAGFAAVLIAGAFVRIDEETVRAMLQRLGPVAPLAYLAAEVVQVVVIPVPGQPLEIPAGWYFGFPVGLVLGSVGAMAGSMIAFGLGRRYGRPWVSARVPEDVRARFGAKLGSGDTAAWAVFWLMLLPAFPRDPLCYLAGLTDLTPGRFALIAAIGRPIGMAPWVALGAGGWAFGLWLQVSLAAAVGLVWLAVTLLRRRRSASPAGERVQ